MALEVCSTIEMAPFKLRQGNSPLLVSMPHVGTFLPSWLLPRLTNEAKTLVDTDWHLEALYNFLEAIDATVVIATHSRYVIDLNRSPDNVSLYPGQNTTGLCPLDSFDLKSLYQADQEPDSLEIDRRIIDYWQPYHTTLTNELARIKKQHGTALLWDAHSICSKVPRFFTGELAHLSLGTVDNQSCAASLTNALEMTLAHFPQYSSVINGRFKGGYITRQYGEPQQNVHAVQLEIAMRSYMLEDSAYLLSEILSEALRPTLRSLLATMLQWAKKRTS